VKLEKDPATSRKKRKQAGLCNVKHEAQLIESACAMLDWDWNYSEPFKLGSGQSLLSMH